MWQNALKWSPWVCAVWISFPGGWHSSEVSWDSSCLFSPQHPKPGNSVSMSLALAPSLGMVAAAGWAQEAGSELENPAISPALCLAAAAQKEQMALSNLGTAGFIIHSTVELWHEIRGLGLALERDSERNYLHIIAKTIQETRFLYYWLSWSWDVPPAILLTETFRLLFDVNFYIFFNKYFWGRKFS